MPESPRPIYELPAVSEVDGSISFPVDQAGTAKRLYYADLAAQFNTEDTSGVTVTVDKTSSGDGVASMSATEVFGYARNGVPVTLVIKTDDDTYVEAELSRTANSGTNYTAEFYQDFHDGDTAKIWTLDENKNVAVSKVYDFYDKSENIVVDDPHRITLNYAPSHDNDAANKYYVDWAVYNSGDAGKVVVLEVDQNERVFNGEESITGAQINALAESEKAVFLYDSDNDRLYIYSEPNASGGAVFYRSDRSGVYYETVAAATNAATFSTASYLPNVTAADEGKALGVINGAWGKMELGETVSVEIYGAVGDGVTDDTQAIQTCIDDNPNSTILFSGGIYCISNTIDLWGASGGQMILLGGATIKWIGEASDTAIMLRVSKDYTPTVSSFCRIVGGNIDGDSKAGICIQNLAFYTDVGGTKILNFTNCGILNGTLEFDIDKSTQAKFHDLHIFQRDGDFSADNTAAIVLSYPDNQISNVVTNRTGTAYRLYSGGNSFSNCHSTIEYRDASSLTVSTFGGKHIELMPENSGTTQENVFSNMYFNAGKYVVYAADQATSLITHIASSHYTFYRTASLPFRGEGFLFAGHPGVFVCDSFDVLVGVNFDFYDYFPETAPTESTVPRKLEVNQNHRHPEASIFSANNYCTESSKPCAIANTTNPIPQSGQYYLVGAILESYTPSASIEDRYQGAVKIEWSATDNHNEAVITFDNGEPKIAYEMVGAITPDHMVYIGTVASTVTIDSVTYNWYPIYVYASAGVAYRMTLKAYSLDYYTKCYVRSHLTSDIQPESVDASTLLRLGAKRGVTTSRVNLGNVAFTGSYNDLADKPDFARKPVTIWEVDGTTVTSGLAALQTDISASGVSWQLTGLDFSPYKRIKVYSKGGQGSTNAGTTGAMILEMSLDSRMAISTQGGHYVGSVLCQKPNDANRFASLTCAVSADKTSFAVLRQTSLYGTAATTNNDIGADVVLIEGYYD